MRKKISQREAIRLRKENSNLKAQITASNSQWSSHVDGKFIVRLVIDEVSAAKLDTAMKLGFGVKVVRTSEKNTFDFHSVKQ